MLRPRTIHRDTTCVKASRRNSYKKYQYVFHNFHKNGCPRACLHTSSFVSVNLKNNLMMGLSYIFLIWICFIFILLRSLEDRLGRVKIMYNFDNVYQFTAHWLLRLYNATFLCVYWFLFIAWWVCPYTNMSPLTKNQCRVFDT